MQPLEFDARPVIAAGDEPFDQIMAAVASLAPAQDFVVYAPFEPVPLEGVLGSRQVRTCRRLGRSCAGRGRPPGRDRCHRQPGPRSRPGRPQPTRSNRMTNDDQVAEAVLYPPARAAA